MTDNEYVSGEAKANCFILFDEAETSQSAINLYSLFFWLNSKVIGVSEKKAVNCTFFFFFSFSEVTVTDANKDANKLYYAAFREK